MEAKKHEREPERLAALRQFSILDSFTEKDYEDITHMASIICDTPVALISFVDENRQWFKSHYGVDATETPREMSFCAHAILNIDDALIVEDSRQDARFMDNPLVTGDPNIVFYAGFPLVTDDGLGLGTVCVIDRKPKTLNDQQISALKILSRQTMNLLQLRKINNDLKVSEQELATKNELLTADRLKEMEAQNASLEKMNKELQAFNYISSHDLQEPLRKIQMFTSLISEKESDVLSGNGMEYLSKIERASERMRALITDLLAYSRTTFSEKVFRIMTLSDIIEHVKMDLEEEILEKQAEVILLADCDVRIIPFQFRQLIYNLISNALKFSDTSRKTRIEVQCEGHCDDYYKESKLHADSRYSRILVRDNGIGFDNAYNEKIFELFKRLSNHETQIGTGIGLAIVKKIVENHDGFVVASSEPGAGTSFEIYIPEIQG